MTTVFSPGRVNLIGEHTDYTGGLVLPLALHLGVTFTGSVGGDRVVLDSEDHDRFELSLDAAAEAPLDDIQPAWGRFVVAVARRLGVSPAVVGSITSSLPIGGTGLSSSTALSCVAALLYGAEGDRLELAKLVRAAEVDVTGVEIGLMDQAACLAATDGHALLMDCGTLAVEHVPLPASIEVLIVHSGHARELVDSEYADRRASCERIEQLIGPLREADLDAVAELDDPVLARRARHVVTENGRVRSMVDALAAGDAATAGEILAEGHASLAEDYEVSIPVVDELVARLAATDGIHGARMTGGGFGGSIVALCEPGVTPDVTTWWARTKPSAGARIIDA